MRIVEAGQTRTLGPEHFVGAGGEGDVYVRAQRAYKVFHDPNRATPLAKIQALAPLASATVLAPDTPLFDDAGRLVGYAMRAIPDAWPLCRLFTSAFRTRHGVDAPAIAALAELMRVGVTRIHRAGIHLVDLNETNFLVDATFERVFFIDVDSYQTPDFPATALMESVRDRLASVYDARSDWFSFAVVTFQLFTGIHPYRGLHPTVKGLDARALAGLTVLDPAVRLPPRCDPARALPPAWRGWYRAVLERGAREAPPPLDAAVHWPATPRPSAAFIRLSDTYGAVRLHTQRGGHEVLVTATHCHLDGRVVAPAPPPKRALHVGLAGSDRPVLAWIDDGALQLLDLHTGARVPCILAATGLTDTEGRLFALSGAHLVDVQLRCMGAGLLATPRTVAHVRPLAVTIWPGVALQVLLGSVFAHVLPARGPCAQVRLPTLDGRRIVDATCTHGVLKVAALKANGDRQHLEIDLSTPHHASSRSRAGLNRCT